ncbi:MAG: hypothetical protein NW215_02435 [Hyphomicrobiales bacterium]|nr:hypothetical protein [Hyphomicrobiales bacterium]
MIMNEDAGLQGGWTPRQIRNLKIAVVAMGVMLIVGFVALLIGFVHQASKMGRSAAPPAAPEALAAPAAPSSRESVISIGADAEVVATHAAGGMLVVEVKREGGRDLLFIDPQTGALVSKTALRPE